MKFEDYSISNTIKTNLTSKGFRRPTDIQYKAIPPILKGEDVLAIAQTGTGKTAAFAIPVIHNIQQLKRAGKGPGISCLVMAPTHELAQQISDVFVAIAKNTGVKITVIMGGVDQDPQIERLKTGTDVLVATPGRLFDLVSQGHLKLQDVKTLILDEADHMLDLGFIKDINDLIRFLPSKRQTLFFSATINKKIKKLAYSLVNKPIRIQISPKNPVAKTIEHQVAFIEMDDKRAFLERLVDENPGAKILVFVRTKVRAERVKKAMARVEIDSDTIHSDKEQAERDNTMKRFKSGELKLLIATDVSARGIDIPNVDFVVNYDLPEVAENYVHRVGRTGRGNQKGKAVSFCSAEEREILDEIESFLDKEISRLDIEKSDYADTLEFTKDTDYNWQKLMRDNEREIKEVKKKKKKK
ncbi:DEAD/DEAH box helicase [Draconibacterium sp. IB214405]|uniref:DEAD/DEAH box helicase n=1 Tax=Draconibacterium sp. IB214405 TaxID=3097352 RepID=UPI002A15E0CD|nr:DEAD/DEAH box helicase [Draconibacterium sp. IB214405]MDX8340093.1 DEAD/DEAH box helicase [Draconibacterium sp. IB214405]